MAFEHRAELNKSGIPDAWIATQMPTWRSVDESEARAILGRDDVRGGGIAFEYPPVGSGYSRVRLDVPLKVGGGEARYLSPRGANNRLYVPMWVAGLYQSGATPPRLIVTEGEKKAEAICAVAGVPAVALAGVWSWKTKAGRGGYAESRSAETRPLLEFDALNLGNLAEAIVVFDSDAAAIESVSAAALALGKYLKERGVKTVRVKFCPGARGHKKMGADDWLVKEGRDWFLDWLDSDDDEVSLDDELRITRIHKVLYDQPLYIVVFGSKAIRMTAAEMEDWTRFKRKVFHSTGRFPQLGVTKSAQAAWEKMISKLCVDPRICRIHEPPTETSRSMEIWEAMVQYISRRADTDLRCLESPGGVAKTGKAYLIRHTGIMEALARQFRGMRGADVWMAIQEVGGDECRSTLKRVGAEKHRIWEIPIKVLERVNRSEDDAPAEDEPQTEEQALLRHLGIA